MTTESNVTHLVRGNAAAELAAAPEREAALRKALSSLDSMRAALLGGQIKCFVAVGIAPDHSTFAWSGKSHPTTNLEVEGALFSLLRNIEGMSA